MVQVECLVQLQQHSTCSKAQCKEGLITVELVPLLPVGVSTFLLCPPDGPAAVK